MKPAVSMINIEQISTADLEEYEIVIIPSFVLPIDSYVHVLTRMARHTINGVLHSFLTEENAALAGPLTEILEQCGQAVPEALRKLCLTASMWEQWSWMRFHHYMFSFFLGPASSLPQA